MLCRKIIHILDSFYFKILNNLEICENELSIAQCET